MAKDTLAVTIERPTETQSLLKNTDRKHRWIAIRICANPTSTRFVD
jgi:hypothetical protein